MNRHDPETRRSNNTRLIPLSRGLFAVVDAKDYEQLSQYKWYADTPGPRKIYAAKAVIVDGKQRHLLMHRQLLGLTLGDKREVDHKDGNGLNNTRHNLRLATRNQNRWNQSKHSRNTSGYKGVCRATRGKKWQTQIGFNGKLIWLGQFSTKEEAHQAYCEAAKHLHGEFAYLKK